ncbi:hypothetical protein INT43_003899 [Umbelopsis isabellina]|uniref:LIM zinc-binding domain-containing protein n=1 Tax=Mortierella isabellina TaxID=91625 RepID=A0A8H7UC34_MORIS|nr:hypothetical protein INT43_003899 [Umbelopsis isabellina]
MHKTSDPRISQILPTVTCSDCGLPVELRKLGEHVCSSAPPLPPLKAPAVPAKEDKLSLPFLEKYSKMTGKAMTSLRTAAAAAPSLSEGLYKSVTSRTGTYNNSGSNESMHVDTPLSTSPQNIAADPKKSYIPESHDRRPSIASSASSGTRRNNSGDDNSSSNRYFKDTRGIDPILEDEDNYNPTPSRSARTERHDDFYGHKPLSNSMSTSRKKGPFFLGNLSQENINQTRKNSYSSYRRSDDDDFYALEDESSPSNTNYGFLRHDTSPSRSSSGDEVNSPRTPGSISYKEESGFYNSRFNINDTRAEPKPSGVRRPSMKNKPDTDVLDSMMADLMKDVSGDFDPCHRECLSCTLCRAELGDRTPYFEFEHQLYCERDYNVVRRRVICTACEHPIASNAKSIKALGGQYHVGHLRCHHCREPVDKDTTGIVEHKGRVFCKYDFKELYLPKCTACKKPVEREAVSAADGKLKGKWHRECFGCHTCRRPFPNNTFYVFESLPYCKRHYHRLNNSLCRQCDEPIEGPCAQTAEGWRFHPPCFTCQVCRCAITDVYYMLENQIYCEVHIGHMQRKKNMRAEKRRTQFGRI